MREERLKSFSVSPPQKKINAQQGKYCFIQKRNER